MKHFIIAPMLCLFLIGCSTNPVQEPRTEQKVTFACRTNPYCVSLNAEQRRALELRGQSVTGQ